MTKKATGMKGDGDRSRDNNGEVRRKRGDTFIGTVEQEYNRDFGVRADMKLENFLQKNNLESLHDLIKSDLGK